MCDVDMLFEYGLIGGFDTVAMMRGEEIAIAYGWQKGAEEMEEMEEMEEPEEVEECEEDEGSASKNDDSVDEYEYYGISFLDVQFNSQQLAALLYHRFGVRNGDAVAILCHSHAAAEVTATLACARIGAPFVPLDDSWLHQGKHRLGSIIDDCKPQAAIVVGQNDQAESVRKLASVGLYRCVLLNEDGSIVIDEASSADFRDDLPQNPFVRDEDCSTDEFIIPPLYILYTSGSTGTPKGVLGSHWGLINRIAWQIEQFPFSSFERETACRRTPLTFVDALVEMFAPLLAAVPLWSPPREELAGGLLAYANSAAEMKVSRLTLLPTHLIKALQVDPNFASSEVWPSLRYIHVSGEPCPTLLIELVAQNMPHVTLINLYGSTEVAGDVSFAMLTESSTNEIVESMSTNSKAKTVNSDSEINRVFAPIGYPITNNLLIIANEVSTESTLPLQLRLCSDGVIGELLVLGHHVASGYYNRSKETSSRFLDAEQIEWLTHESSSLTTIADCEEFTQQHLFMDQKKLLYRTGDLVIRDPETKAITWLGRADHQVKIRGIRVELEDVQASICKAMNLLNGVAIIAADIETIPDEINSTNLHAYENLSLIMFIEDEVISEFILGQTASSNESHLQIVKSFLRTQLPEPFQPTLILQMPKILRTTAGKIDRPALKIRLVEFLRASNQQDSEDSAVFEIPAASNEEELQTINSTLEELIELMFSIFPRSACLRLQRDEGDQHAAINISNLSLSEIGFDSLKRIELLWHIKKRLGVELKMNYLQEMTLIQIAQRIDLIRGRSNDYEPIVDKSATILASSAIAAEETSNVSSTRHFTIPVESRCIKIINRFDNLAEWANLPKSANVSESDIQRDEDIKLQSKLVRSWSQNLNRCIDSSALFLTFEYTSPVQLDTVETLSLAVIGSHGGDVVATNTSSGVVIWSTQLIGHIEAAVVGSTDGNMLYICSYLGNDVDGCPNPSLLRDSRAAAATESKGSVWALESTTGAIMWHCSLPAELKSSPVIVHSRRQLLVGCYDGSLYLLRCQDGFIVGCLDCGGPIYAVPTLIDSTDVVFCSTIKGQVHRIRFQETVDRTITANPTAWGCFEWSIDIGPPIFSSLLPLMDAKLDLTLSTSSQSFPELKRARRNSEDNDDAGLEPESYSAFPKYLVFGCVDGILRCISSEDGSLVWTSDATRPVFSTPCICYDGDSPVVVFGSHDAFLRAVSASDGELLWECDCSAALFASPIYFSTPASGGMISVATTAGHLLLLRSTSGQILSELKFDAEIFSTPVVVTCVPPTALSGSAESIVAQLFIGCRDDKLHAVNVLVS